ncbi:fibrinogen alpha chain [Eucyclogobius newberryi]|uniref:fibrinogen alpha chain n=1 Tax=Eucyclogobius newberryi TaxID=166745 RepID=UPI003B5BA19E
MKVYALALALVCSAAAQIDPRGARPVVPNTRSEKCATQKEWPFCTDDEWGPKCPSGCRIQGLLEKYDHTFLKKVERIRSLLDQSNAKHRSADQVSKQTFDFLREKLTLHSGNDNNYLDVAQTLRQRITDMKIKIDQQLQVLGALKERVRDQVADMQRLEVDIDMKLRTCKGSCKAYNSYEVDGEGHVALEKQTNQLNTLSDKNFEGVGTLHLMKSRPLKDVLVNSVYKSKDPQMAQQKTEDMFPEVKTMQLFLEEEGSSSSPATISKVPGTSLSSGTSTSSSSSSSSSSSTTHKSITELGDSGGFGMGGGFDSLGQPGVTTKSVSCTKRVRTVVVDNGDGPVQKMEEYMEGGPECETFSKGGMESLFPSLSGSGTKTVHYTSSSKGSLSDSKTSFADPFGGDAGLDLGAFMTDNAEDDVPDFHARSVKSARVERQADYVGKDCAAANQFHLNGESNGLFKIQPAPSAPVVTVYCQQEGLMGGWLLAQRRESGALSFNRTWAEYRGGFGSVDAQGGGEFWLGNENLHLLTNQGETMLKIELVDWEGGEASAEYVIKVGSEAEGFPLHVSGYTGDAGDALAAHSGMKFSTYDRRNDAGSENCASFFGGGWWYGGCRAASLNGVYREGADKRVENGVVWPTYKPPNYSLKQVRMFLRAAAF